MTLKRIGTVSSVSKFEQRFWIALVVVIALAFVVGFATVAQGWTLQDCVEVDFDHPDCDQYVTTTTEAPPSTTSSTQPGSTTSTSGPESPTTTSTTSELPTVTTTSTDTPTPTTTTVPVQECPPGMIHQPPLCLEPTTTAPPVPDTTPDTTTVIDLPEELPFTGVSDIGLLALAGVSLGFLGFTALRYGRSEE